MWVDRPKIVLLGRRIVGQARHCCVDNIHSYYYYDKCHGASLSKLLRASRLLKTLFFVPTFLQHEGDTTDEELVDEDSQPNARHDCKSYCFLR